MKLVRLPLPVIRKDVISCPHSRVAREPALGIVRPWRLVSRSLPHKSSSLETALWSRLPPAPMFSTQIHWLPLKRHRRRSGGQFHRSRADLDPTLPARDHMIRAIIRKERVRDGGDGPGPLLDQVVAERGRWSFGEPIGGNHKARVAQTAAQALRAISICGA